MRRRRTGGATAQLSGNSGRWLGEWTWQKASLYLCIYWMKLIRAGWLLDGETFVRVNERGMRLRV